MFRRPLVGYDEVVTIAVIRTPSDGLTACEFSVTGERFEAGVITVMLNETGIIRSCKRFCAVENLQPQFASPSLSE